MENLHKRQRVCNPGSGHDAVALLHPELHKAVSAVACSRDGDTDGLLESIKVRRAAALRRRQMRLPAFFLAWGRMRRLSRRHCLALRGRGTATARLAHAANLRRWVGVGGDHTVIHRYRSSCRATTDCCTSHAKADPSALAVQDADGFTPLHVALQTEGKPDLVRLLVEHVRVTTRAHEQRRVQQQQWRVAS